MRPPPPGVEDASEDSNGSATLLSSGTHADDGFVAPRGKTTPFHAAVPREFTQPRVNTRNSFGGLDEGDDDNNTATDPDAPTPTRPFQEAHRAAEESLDSVLNEIREKEMAHQRRIDELYDEMEVRRTRESRQASFLSDFDYKMRQVDQALSATATCQSSFLSDFDNKMRQVDQALSVTATRMTSLADTVTTIESTLTNVATSTTRMNELLDANCTQLQQLRDNETARVAAMQEHRDRLDTMDTFMGRVHEKVMMSVNLALEVDSKLSATRQATLLDTQERPPAQGLISPPRPSSTGTTQQPSDDAAPDDNTNMDGSQPASSTAPHRFANVRLGPDSSPISQRASTYPPGNRPPTSLNGLPRANSRSAHFEHPPDPRFHDSRSLHVDTSPDPMDPPNPGGQIESPRPSDKERQARIHKTSIYDIAGLASPAYHGNQYGNATLEISFIHMCGYQSISTALAEDVLLCYRDIQQVHRKVRQGWTNPRTQFSGPLVERILDKGLTTHSVPPTR